MHQEGNGSDAEAAGGAVGGTPLPRNDAKRVRTVRGETATGPAAGNTSASETYSRCQMREAFPPAIWARSCAEHAPIISSMTLREYGQSLPWCG
jgi:hypothetical protein